MLDSQASVLSERIKYPQEIIDNSQFLEVNFFDLKVASDEERYDIAIDHRRAHLPTNEYFVDKS
jgi:hypothetical protein